MVRPPMGRAILLILFALIQVLPATADGRKLVVGKDHATVQATVDAATNGDVVLVPKGVWRGRVVVKSGIILRGDQAILDGGKKGRVLTLAAPGIVVDNLEIRGSGEDLGTSDSCIYIEPSAKGAVVEHSVLRDCAFGIWVHETLNVRIEGNRIWGRKDLVPSERGNGIHLFDATKAVIRGNTVSGARDGIYVSAVEDSLIENNRVEHQRYGVHYMYSNGNTLRNNQSNYNISGFALMQSHHIVVVNNTAKGNRRHGVLFRDAQYCNISGNKLIENGEGFFFFSSTDNTIANNEFVRNLVGARVWAGSVRNLVSGNAFIGNDQQIYYVGAKDLHWGTAGQPGNFWSDYMGWDQDGDGRGDRPYRLDSFTATLIYRYPAAILLLRSPAMELLAHMEESLPLLRVPTVVDKAPLIKKTKVKVKVKIPVQDRAWR